MGQYDAQIASLVSGIKSGSFTSKVTGSTRLPAGNDFMSILKQNEAQWKANAPSPMNAQELRVHNSFQSLDAPTRLNTLNTLVTQAKAGSADAQRKLQYLTPTATLWVVIFIVLNKQLNQPLKLELKPSLVASRTKIDLRI